jgi:hypothetical protein
MSITDKISKHYQTAIKGELKSYYVAEWDETVYFRSTYPLQDEARILQLQGEGKTIEALVESIIVKSRNAEGKRIFQEHDRLKLMNEADPVVVIKLASAINNAKIELDQESVAKE